MENRMWKENSLDPNDWESFLSSGEIVLKHMVEFLSSLDQKKVFQLLSYRDYEIDPKIPFDGMPLNLCCDTLVKLILKKHSPMNLSPGFFGWAMGSGNPVNILTSIVVSALNPNVIGGNQISCFIERQVLDWLKTMINFPPCASGILTSGCTEANLIALTVARNHKEIDAIQKQGLQGRNYVFYASDQVHGSIVKSLQIIGLGSDNLHLVPVNECFCMDVCYLKEQIEIDIKKGYFPIGIVVSIGTVNTGAIDHISEVSKIAKEYNMWLHADGAFGVFGLLADGYETYKAMIPLLDSIAFDLHKWMQISYAVGCVFIKDQELHHKTFTLQDSYVEHSEKWISDYGISLSRNFSALYVWMFLKTYGFQQLKQCIEKNINQARYLYEKLAALPQYETLCIPTLNVVCFRYMQTNTEQERNRINRAIVSIVQLHGNSFPTGTTINGWYYIRVCIMNYRTETHHLDQLIQECDEAAAIIQ